MVRVLEITPEPVLLSSRTEPPLHNTHPILPTYKYSGFIQKVGRVLPCGTEVLPEGALEPGGTEVNMNLYSVLPPMVAKLENTLRSVMLSGQDWMFRKPKQAQMQKDTRLNSPTPGTLH